jgi:O-antigen/teichoic acid export membrane protein
MSADATDAEARKNPPAIAPAGLTSGIAPLAISRALIVVIQFVTLAILARALGPNSYGLIQFGVALFVYVGLSNDLGLTILGARTHAAPDDLARTRGALIGARLLLTAAAVAIVLPALIIFPLGTEGRLVGAILVVGHAVSSLNVRWVMQAEERFVPIAIGEAIGSCVQLLVVLLFVHGPGDVGWAAIATVAMPISSTVILGLQAGLLRRIPVAIDRRSLGLIRQAAPLGVALLATALYYSADSVLLGIFRGSEEVGYYAAAYRIVLACLIVPVVVHSVLLPTVARLQRTRATSLTETLQGASRGLIWIALPLAVGTAMTSATVIAFVFGPAYAPSAPALALLIWSCVTVSANVPFAVLMLARSQDRMYMAVTGLGAVINLVFNLVAIPALGMIGAAATTLISEVSVLGAILWYTRDVSARIVVRSFGWALPPTVIMAAVVFPFRDQVAAFPIGVLAYLIASVATRALSITNVRRMAADMLGRTPTDAGDARR